MAKSKSSKRWLAVHFDDHYVRQAQQRGLRSRSAFKLMELQDKYRFIRPGMTVVDLGAAPGGWCQVVQPLAIQPRVSKSQRVELGHAGEMLERSIRDLRTGQIKVRDLLQLGDGPNTNVRHLRTAGVQLSQTTLTFQV